MVCKNVTNKEGNDKSLGRVILIKTCQRDISVAQTLKQ